MKYPLSLLILLISLLVNGIAYADNTVKGEATIIVDNETYTLSLKKCYSGSNLVDGQTFEAFIIATHLSRKSKALGPLFSATGSKTIDKTETLYSLRVDGGFLKGGTRYIGKMPYDSFKDNKLVFKGKADSIKRENKKPIKKIVSIEINVKCF